MILEKEYTNIIECSPTVIWWNYWDLDHLDVVHPGYVASKILFEKDNVSLQYHTLSIPLIPFLRVKTMDFSVQVDNTRMENYAFLFNVPIKTTVTVEQLDEKKSKIIVNYKFELTGWKKLFSPILNHLIPKWNERVWMEDLPIKLRRQKALELGFKDWIGLPLKVSERHGEIPELKLPIKRFKNSPRDGHPFQEKH